MNNNSPKIVVIGGGTGSFMLLSALKNYVENISAIVNMVDDGGSSGKLRDEMGVLPAGDIRQCLVALSDSSEEMRELFNFRFSNDSLKGHSFGNLFLSALEEMTDSFDAAINVASSVLNVKGKVIPVTLDKVRLVMEDGDSKIIGEKHITEHQIENAKQVKLYTRPKARVNPEVIEAIENADIVCVAPGNLYSSLIPTLLIEGVSESLSKTNAKVIYVCNLMTKPGQTDDFAVSDFVDELERFTKEGIIDYVLYNNQEPSQDLIDRYASEGEYPVKVNEDKSHKHVKYIGDDFVSSKIYKQDKNDVLISRTLIRHNADRVIRKLMQLYFAD